MPIGIRLPLDEDMRAALGMGEETEEPVGEARVAPRYRIPPVLWVFLCLGGGWFLVRALLED